MLDHVAKAMEEAGSRVAEADAETLWSMIQEKAQHSALASTILNIAKFEDWTVVRTALALAYAHIILTDAQREDIIDLLMIQQPRTIIVKKEDFNG